MCVSGSGARDNYVLRVSLSCFVCAQSALFMLARARVFLPQVASQLRLLNRDWDWVVEPGSFSVSVGGSSAVAALSGKFVVVR